MPQNDKRPPCSRTDRVLQDAGKFISDIGGDITAGSAHVGLVGGVLAAGGAVTGNVPAAGVGTILLGRAGAGITVGGFVSYVGAFLQVAGGAPKAAATTYVNNAIASRIPGLPQVAGSYLKTGLKKGEALLPDFDVCSR